MGNQRKRPVDGLKKSEAYQSVDFEDAALQVRCSINPDNEILSDEF